jgi:hypothetical protein
LRRHTTIAIAVLVTLLAGCSAAPSGARPQSLADTLTAHGACFARVYDAAHLASHPNQTVRRFFVGDAGEAWRAVEAAGEFHVAFGFQLVDREDLYSGVALCEPRDSAASCLIEGDGGAFTIESNGEGLRVEATRIEVEGPNDFSPDLALADNRVMLLHSAQANECSEQ